MSVRVVPALAALSLFSGCAIHPLPENVTGLSTNIIVRQIRCETREAVIDSILGYLTNEGNLEGGKVNLQSYNLGWKFKEAYKDDPFSISKFDPTKLTGFARSVVGLLWNTGIAYNYDLEMTETNNVDPTIDLLRTLPTSSHMLGLQGNFDRQRENTRTFTITDNFGGLVKNVPADYCTKKFIADANVVYPIAGEVGMKKVVQDFLVLTLFDNLSADASKDVTLTKGPPTMVDQLDFVTTIGGTATPKITFTPVGTGLHVADASIGLTASRKDEHKLTVGLYLAAAGEQSIGPIRAGLFQSFVAARGGPAEKGAAAAVDQFLRQKALQPKVFIQQQ
jgi:hypothetical protein